jgi:hypothetical protein
MDNINVNLTIAWDFIVTRFDYVETFKAILETSRNADSPVERNAVLILLNTFTTKTSASGNDDLATISTRLAQDVMIANQAERLSKIEARNERLKQLTPTLVSVSERAKKEAKEIRFEPIVQHLNNAATAIQAIKTLEQGLNSDASAMAKIQSIITAIEGLASIYKLDE